MAALNKISRDIHAQAEKANMLIDAYGFYVQHVSATFRSLPFSYTVGLPDYIGHPEIFIMSLPKDVTLPLLNILVEKIQNGETVTPGTVLTDVSSQPCMLVPAKESVKTSLPLEAVELCTGKTDYDVMQLVWSDHNSRFPHHPDFDTHLKSLQPVYSNISILM